MSASQPRWLARALALLVMLAALVASHALPLVVAAPIPANTATPAPTTSAPTPDALENNWSPATAAPIAVGVVYDLNFVCPVARGCAGGDHDYLRLSVKRGLRYLIATFDLGLGVDTELDLFWGSEQRPLVSNDDVYPGRGFQSAIRWVAPSDGEAIIRVAPRAGGLTPMVFDERASAYRFAVALAGTDLARQIERRLAGLTDPTPIAQTAPEPRPATTASTAATSAAPPSGTPAPAAPAVGASGSPSGITARGQALVVARESAFRIAPNPNASLIGTLPLDTTVTLAGQYAGLWVSVTTADSVLPGWVLGTDLRRMNAAAPTSAVSPTATLTPAPTPPPSGAIGSPGAAVRTPAYRVRALAPLPLDPAPGAPPHSVQTIVVMVVAAPVEAGIPTPRATPTDRELGTPLAGIRVQLVDAFGALLAEALTAADGQVALTPDVAAATRLSVRLPAAGLEIALDTGATALTITIPIGDR